jgi:alginate O-acetyltransferase complex protein AlgI
LLIVMLFGGLWHGASWNFLIWGGLHGSFLVVERSLGKRALYHALPRPARVALTFVIVLFGWVFFRAPDLPSALSYCATMLGLHNADITAGLLTGIVSKPYYLMTFALCGMIIWTCPQTWDWSRRLTPAKVAIAFTLFLLSVIVLTTQAYNPFIYYIF